jgi:hypothetical protein
MGISKKGIGKKRKYDLINICLTNKNRFFNYWMELNFYTKMLIKTTNDNLFISI